eukprot:NODE_1673_length_797_cov_348.997326_g1301_i0.p1 GENE.NODE_1673_length_797_cov_348.997326_g1301_i0~~NODE_1673_length_797_cov_348.997326_g1301_i0.p1  ORF type:complete len:168 (-),score=7.21 NODE_1673_length_797_cov_348.997326_g1301_i0:161-664(-)
MSSSILVCSLFLVISCLCIASPYQRPLVDLDGSIVESDWFSYSVCDKELNILDVTDLRLSSERPSAGSDLEIDVKAILGSNITSINVDVAVYWNHIRFLQKTYDGCQELRDLGDSAPENCPIAAGDKDLHVTTEISGPVLPGRYSVYVKAFDQLSRQVWCADLKFSL